MSKLAVVTGGVRGIGAAICKELKKENFIVAATYGHNDDVANKFKKETGIDVFKWDVSNHDECASGVEQMDAW